MRETFVAVGNTNVYLASPNHITNKWILGIHGSGRSPYDYQTTAFYVYQRDLTVNHGCTFVCPELVDNVWGKPEGISILDSVFNYMVDAGFSDKHMIIAVSAGGSLMFRYAELHPERLASLIGIFPVWDIEAMDHPAMKKAWNTDNVRLKERVRLYNPARYPEALPDVPIVICHGKNDTVVPLHDHAAALAAIRNIDLFVTEDQHSIQAFDLYKCKAIDKRIIEYSKQH